MRHLVLFSLVPLLLASSKPEEITAVAQQGASKTYVGPDRTIHRASAAVKRPFDVRIVNDLSEQRRREASEAVSARIERENSEAAKRSARAAEVQADLAYPTLVVGILGALGLIIALTLSFCANRTAGRSLALAKDTSDHQLRAYLGVSEARASLAGEDEIAARLVVKNFGSTPAHNVSARVRGWVGSFPSHITTETHPLPEDQSFIGTVHPGGTFEIYACGSIPDSAAVANGDQGLYVYGDVRYLDFNKVPRITNFCWRGTESTLLNKGELRPSFHGNDAD